MFYFKGCFKAMEDVGILDMDNPFPKKKFHSNIFFNNMLWMGMLWFGSNMGL